MKLSEIFTQLSMGELSQISLGGVAAGELNSLGQDKLVAHVNLGLLALYKRFNLKEGRLAFSLDFGRSLYPLSTDSDVRFVEVDGVEFADDILKIEKVLTDDGFELGLNDASDPYGCTTPGTTTLRLSPYVVGQSFDLPEEYKTGGLTVVYRASHPMLVKRGDNFNASRVEVELPYSHLDPLLLFVASRIHNPIGMSNEFHAGNSYYAKYEKACQELEVRNLAVDQGSQNTRLVSGGWV
jgi:hypothetical protein